MSGAMFVLRRENLASIVEQTKPLAKKKKIDSLSCAASGSPFYHFSKYFLSPQPNCIISTQHIAALLRAFGDRRVSTCLVLWARIWQVFSNSNLHSTLIYTSELILCSTICVHSAFWHNIHMYPYFLFAAILHLNRPLLSLSDLVAQSAE